MARDSAATSARILRAAIEEFTTFGFAGARIDRIAEAAGANKRSIYVYFTSKDLLFDTALDAVIGELVEAVPVTAAGLPEYAGAMFDYLIANPAAFRLSLWRLLERPQAGPDDAAMYAAKLAGATGDSGFDPVDLVVLVNALTTAWMITPPGLLAAGGADPDSAERRAQHRTVVVEAARRLVARPDTVVRDLPST